MPSTVDNSKNSHILAIFNLLAIVIGIAVCVIFNAWPTPTLQAIVIILSVLSAFINFRVNAINGDAWKAWVGWLVVLVTIAIYIWPASVNSIK